MRTKATLLATAGFAAFTLAAPADAAGNFYASVFGGANWLQDSSFVATATGATTVTAAFASDADTGFIVGGAVGMSLNQFMQGLRVEAEVAYRQQNVGGVFATTTTTGIFGTVATGTLDYDHSTLSVMANAWYDFNVAGVSPYVGGGIGWARTELDGTYSFVLPIPAVAPLSFDESGFAWQIGAGVNFDIAPNMKLGVGYRYFEGPDVTVSDSLTGLASSDVEDQNHTVLVNLTIGF